MIRRRAIVCFILIVCCWSVAQDVPPEQIARAHRWDGAHNVLFLGMGLYSQTGLPIRAYQDGVQRAADIDVFKDFPDVQRVLIEDAAASISGSTILAVVLNFGDSLRHVLLTYDSEGKLRQIWDTEPYYVQAIATDDEGHVYVIGNRLDERPGDQNAYPLFSEYDTSGRIAAQSLSSSLFITGSAAINPGHEPGNASLMVKDGKLFLYAPFENEIVIFRKNGTIVKRARLQTLLKKITQNDKVDEITVRNIVFVDEHRVALDINEHQHEIRPGLPSLIVANFETNQYRVVLKKSTRDWSLFGINNGQLLTIGKDDTKNVFMKHDADPH